MSNLKLIHCADFHLGSSFSSVADIAQQRSYEHLQCFFNTVNTAHLNADLLLIAGDLFDNINVESRIVSEVIRAFSEINIPVFIAGGNHDPVSSDSPYLKYQWPDNVFIFIKDSLEYREIPSLKVRVYGASFKTSSCRSSMLSQAPELDPDFTNILVMHGDICPGDSPYNPLKASTLESSGFDYCALGHVHTAESHSNYAYCGCPEGRGFDETGTKYILSVDFSAPTPKIERIPSSVREYRNIRLNGSCLSPASLIETLGKDFEKHIYRITLTDYEDFFSVCSILNDSLYYVKFSDGKYEIPDYMQISQESTLRGEFVRTVLKKLENDPDNSKKYMLALRYGIEAFDREVSINENN